MSVLRLEGVTKRFGARVVVDAIDMEVARGQVHALLGPSGSGKSTTLRMIAGLERPDAGRITMGERLVSGGARFVPPEERRTGVVFQSFALFPHMSVGENVAFGAKNAPRVDELLELVGLASHRSARCHTLSGGEQQRVALARALAAEPDLVLLDEPFANLDSALRRHLRDEVARTLRAAHATAVLVTHDASEAFSLSDQLSVMADGKILQTGTPEDVYLRPVSLTVAQKTGEVTSLPATRAENGRITCALGQLEVHALPAGEALCVLLRPEQLGFGDSSIVAKVTHRVFEGATTSLTLSLNGQRLPMRTPGHVQVRVGDSAGLVVNSPVCVVPAAP